MNNKITVGDYQINKETLKQLFDVILPFIPAEERNMYIQSIWSKNPQNTAIRLSYGPKSKAFEKKFAGIHGCDYGVLSNSGTSSLQVALQALKEIYGWKEGDEVIVPATTFVATVNVILHNNLKPIFVDVSKETYALDYKLIKAKITPKTRCILPVSLFGIPYPIHKIIEVLLSLGISARTKIIEDACEAAFSFYEVSPTNKIPVGSRGDIGCFSFYVAHILTTGVGGMATTNNKTIADYIRSLVNHGWDRKERPIDVKEFNFEEIKNRYFFTKKGHSFRISELEAALGLAQLETWREDLDKRYLNIKAIYNELKPLEDRNLIQLPPVVPSLMMFPIVCLKGNKWDLIKYLEKNEIETREMLPLINQPIYKDLLNPKEYPVSQCLIDKGFYIGCHHYLSEGDILQVGRVFRKYYKDSL